MFLLQYRLSYSDLVAFALSSLTAYALYWCIYQLYLSPLAKFPGPKIAAVTRLYEFYHDFWRWGQYTFVIREMHKKYGPIVRISPYELHIDDPDFYEILYPTNAPRDKWSYYTRQFGGDLSTFATCDHHHWRLRRGAINPFFSKQRVLKLEVMIYEYVQRLCGRLEEFKKKGDPLEIRLAYESLTTDVVETYAMSRGRNFIDAPDFDPLWHKTVRDLGANGVLFKHVPWLFGVLRALPDKVVSRMNPGMAAIIAWQRTVEKQIKEIMDDKTGEDTKYQIYGQPTLFHTLINSDLPANEKTLDRLWQEGQVVVGAGGSTTADVLTVCTYHLVDNPDKLAKLRKEIETIMPEPETRPRLLELEKLPYLTAVINEGLRLSYGVSSRRQLIAPKDVVKYKDWEIPPGTPVGMTSVMMHHNEDIFPDSHSFIPERWLEPREGKPPLDRYMVSFGKGSRQCIGMNLAKAEIYLTLACVFRRFDFELHDSPPECIELKHDLFLPSAEWGSPGPKVIVR